MLCNWQRFNLINWFSLFSTQLLAPEIRHERNVILQCLRHIVKRNFFDVGDTNLPPRNSVQNEICDEFVNESWKINYHWQQQLLEWSYCTVFNFYDPSILWFCTCFQIGLNVSCDWICSSSRGQETLHMKGLWCSSENLELENLELKPLKETNHGVAQNF